MRITHEKMVADSCTVSCALLPLLLLLLLLGLILVPLASPPPLSPLASLASPTLPVSSLDAMTARISSASKKASEVWGKKAPEPADDKDRERANPFSAYSVRMTNRSVKHLWSQALLAVL
jgi:hypothetical protein